MPPRLTQRTKDSMDFARAENRTIERIERKARARSREVAYFIRDTIGILAPPHGRRKYRHRGPEPQLARSYTISQDAETGDFLISSKDRYWVFVEFGTAEHGSAQPHVRPALDIARAVFK